MNDWKWAITLAACYCIILTVAASASADFVGVTTVTKDDPDTAFLCTQANGFFVPGPLTVCNVYAAFDDPDNVLLNVANADLQVYNGANPDVFFQHLANFVVTSPSCDAVRAFPDLICDSFITIGYKCAPDPAGTDETHLSNWDGEGFDTRGHIGGGWFNADPFNGQGTAGSWPDLQVLFLQSSVAQGLSLSGDIDIFWQDGETGEVFGEVDVSVECAATCGSCPTDSDGDGVTDAADLAVLLGSWGSVDAGDCQDADDDGLIDAFDLAVLLGNWGPCL